MTAGHHVNRFADHRRRGRYRLGNKLGEGAFGQVFLGTDLDEGSDVAVKLFKSGVKLERAVQEAQLQRRLSDHDRVVSLRNVDVRTSAGPIVITEYVAGGSVGSQIGTGSAGLLRGLRWTIDATDALVHAHAEGVFHRDSKPSNLLLDGSGHAALCDFGVAEDCFSTTSGQPLYPMLSAPEQHRTGTTEQTEVWMLGVLLHRLILGSYPYPMGPAGISPTARVQPQKTDPQVSMAMTRIMQQTLAINPADRYASVRELREALLAVKVVAEFQPTSSVGALACWQAQVTAGTATVEVAPSPRATFTARVLLDQGSGPRTIQARPRRSSEAQAMRDARTLLHAVVAGQLP